MRLTPKLILALLALSACLVAPVRAELCTIDVVPSELVLLPYFEVDLKKLANPRKAEVTTIHLKNVTLSGDPIVVTVLVWTDLSVPTVGWDIPLAGWASIDIPVHEIFRGVLPGIEDGADPLGLGADGPALRAAHSGKPVEPWDDECAAQDLGGNRARGYITIEVVGGGTIFAEVSRLSQRGKYGETVPLVHVESGNGGSEPLGSTWGARYSRTSKDQSWVVVWRETPGGQRFTCGAPEELDWYPLEQTQIVGFEADGTPMEIPEGGSTVSAFPAATGLYKIGAGELSLPFKSGWVYFNLNYGGEVKSSYVESVQYLGSGRRRGRSQAVMFTSACDSN